MSGSKHPILLVLVILACTILFLGLAMMAIIKFAGLSSDALFDQKIGVINIEGVIRDSQPIVSQIVEFRKNKNIKAIIIRIDSPGGGVAPSQEIFREIRKTHRTKKVVASLGNMAASGGYYIASAANKIVANPGTITGSIGVIMEFPQVEDLLKKIGVGLEVLKSGEFKDIGSPHRKMSDREKEFLQGLISDIQNQFIQAVSEGRNLPIEKVREFADARILTGKQGKELGLIDQLGNFEDAVDLTKRMTGIEGDVTLVYPKRASWALWDLLFEEASGALYGAIKNRLMPHIEYRWDGLSFPRD